MCALTVSRRPAIGLFAGSESPLLHDRVMQVLRTKQYSSSTIKSYVHWIGRFLRFHQDGRHPRELTEADVEGFGVPSGCGRERRGGDAARGTVCGLVSLPRSAGAAVGPDRRDHSRAKERRPPVVLTPEEADEILRSVKGTVRLVCELLYGTGLGLTEALELRVKDIDFGRGEIFVRTERAGGRDRVTMLPDALRGPLRAHLAEVRRQHIEDLAAGLGRAPMPRALARKYRGVDRDWAW